MSSSLPALIIPTRAPWVWSHAGFDCQSFTALAREMRMPNSKKKSMRERSVPLILPIAPAVARRLDLGLERPLPIDGGELRGDLALGVSACASHGKHRRHGESGFTARLLARLGVAGA